MNTVRTGLANLVSIVLLLALGWVVLNGLAGIANDDYVYACGVNGQDVCYSDGYDQSDYTIEETN